MNRHDQMFKDLFRAFFPELVRLADPGLASRLAEDFGLRAITFLDKEVFHDLPEGRRREADLLAEIPSGSGERKPLVHVEIERQFRTSISRRLWRYSFQICLYYARPVVSIVVFLRGGPPGAQWTVCAEQAFDEEIHRFRFLSLGLSRMPAEILLDRPEPLAWALASLALPGKLGRARLKLALQRKIASSRIGEAKKFLLTNCVETYLQLAGREATEYAALRAAEPTPEVEAMELTWADRMQAQYEQAGLQKGMERGMEKGMEKGIERLRSTLLRQIGQRFGAVSPATRRRIEAISSLDELGGFTDRILEVSSIDELGLGS
ncbi:MAG: hypothetical protein ABJC13_10170 [Acidobacteriota bacterium]